MATGDGHTFIAREFRHRSGEGVLLVGLLLAMGAGCAYGIRLMEGGWKLLPAGLSCSFLVISVVRTTYILRDRREACVIDEEGIRVGGVHWEWAEVREVYAEGWPTKSTIDFRFMPTTGPMVEDVPFRPRLTPAEYEELIAALRRALRSQHPHVEFGGYRNSS